MADGHDEDDELGLLKLADDAIVAQAIAPQTELAVAKRLTKGARVRRQPMRFSMKSRISR